MIPTVVAIKPNHLFNKRIRRIMGYLTRRSAAHRMFYVRTQTVFPYSRATLIVSVYLKGRWWPFDNEASAFLSHELIEDVLNCVFKGDIADQALKTLEAL